MKNFVDMRFVAVILVWLSVWSMSWLFSSQAVHWASFTIWDNYTVQSWDNAQLSGLYDRIDAHMEAWNTQKLLWVYDQLHKLDLLYGTTARNQYFLTKIEDYLTERLFRASTAPDFACIADRVQKGDTVTLEYALKTLDGEQISLSSWMVSETDEREAILFNVWKWSFTQWIDQATYGMRAWSTQWVHLDYQDMYGPAYDNLVVELPRGVVTDALSTPLQSWSRVVLPVMLEDELIQAQWHVVSYDAERVVVDFNAPLAWEDIVGIMSIDALFKNCGWE